MQIYKYETQADYDKIVSEKTTQGLILTNVSNVTEGNFLGFKETEEIPQTIDTELKALKEKIDTVLANQVEVVQLKAEKEVLLQTIVEKEQIISEKEAIVKAMETESKGIIEK